MRVTFVLWFPALGGGTRVLFEVANRLYDRGHDVQVVALKPNTWFPLQPNLIIADNPQTLGDAVPESDVVFATWCWTAYTVDGLNGDKGIGAYYCQHYEPLAFTDAQQQQAIANTYDLPLALVANSPWLQDQLQTKHKRTSHLVVPGVDTAVFHPYDEDDHDAFRICYFSTLDRFKGLYDTTLPALQHVYEHHNHVEFHTYGAEAPYTFPVIHHGHPNDEALAKLYSSCDLYVCGSWYESSPLPHLEAMACGCPIVSTSIGTEHYGNAIMRVPPMSSEALAKCITRYMDADPQPHDMLVDAAKQFPWSHTVDQVEAFLGTIA